MLGLPSTAALRNAAVACVAGAGVALVGLSLSNVASIDGTLAAATEQPARIEHAAPVSFDGARHCPRERPRSSAPASTADGPADVQY